MKARIYAHLKNFKLDTATQEDWEAVLFRLKIGIGLGKKFEEDQVISTEMSAGLDILGKCHATFGKEGTWTMGKEDIDTLWTCLNIVDDLQDNTTRKEQLPVFIAAKHDVDNMVIYENRT